MRTCLIAGLALFVLMGAADLSKEEAILARGRDPERIEAAALTIAASNDPAALADLAKHFGEHSFLQRLDPADGSEVSVIHLGHVFRTLIENPSPATASLCISLAGDREFNSVPARLNFLLNALAAVRPMSAAAANLFRATSSSGYLELNGPLLAKNGSPQALEVLADLFADESLDAEQVVSIAHWGLLPTRTDPAVAAMCARVLSRGGISQKVEIAILESLYDYQPRRWFGLRAGQPSPQPWSSAPAATRDVLRSLGTSSLKRQDLPPALHATIQSTLEQLR